ncbi:MAG: serine/threonine protein kinase [Candidatus Dormibacteraeota bacterium]|nr:serine/threonine protein kinase [Candidatus Dormibacteraeota bacterium]MBV8446035.1 serine/threonine protein kinase [Candidatus Dormibacteraeota bacterium]
MSDASQASVPGYAPVRGIAVDRAGALIDARQDGTGRRVVIRILSPALTADQHFMRRLRNTTQLRESMRHPNLVTVLQVAERGRAVVYEWIDSVTLGRLVQGRPIDSAAAFIFFDDLLCGLQALHQRRLLHRDLRPESCVIDTAGTALVRDADVPSPPLHTGWRSGTPQYMAPELWRGEEHSVASDLYAAGCLFAVAVTGHDPFQAEDINVLRRLHERGDIPGATLAPPLRGLLVEGMAKDPRQRPSDASRYRADLEVAAAAYLDDGWRAKGRAALAALVHERLAAPVVSSATTDSGEDEVFAAAAAAAAAGRSAWWRNGRILALALVAALVLVVMMVVVAFALSAPPVPVQTPAPVPIATPTVSPGSSASGGGPFTAQASPSLQYSGNPVPPSQTPLTPNASPAPPTLSVSSPTPTPTPTPTLCVPLPTPCP